MFKVNSGRKQENRVWRFFEYVAATDKSKCKIQDCGTVLKGKNATNLITHVRSKHHSEWEELQALEKMRKHNETQLTQQLLQVRSIRF
jgi:hypothetical protein